MKIDEFLSKKAKLQAQLDELQAELSQAKILVLEEIKKYIQEFNITFIEVQDIYRSLNLSTAVIKTAPVKPPVADRKGYIYYNALNGKWYNGYNAIPKWFDLAKADSYLVAGKNHTPLVVQAIKANGLDKSPMKNAFTEAQIKEFKDHAAQWDKLFSSKKLSLLDQKVEAQQANVEQILKFANKETQSYIFEALDF